MPVRFPEDEKKLPWLGMMLDAYDITDQAVRQVMAKDEREHGFRMACKQGCHACCHQLIPVTSIELSAIAWFVCHKMTPKARQSVEASIKNHAGDMTCHMLINNSCAVYPVRPFACRQFIVYEQVCAMGEGVFEDRPQHVLEPNRPQTRKASCSILPFYGINTPEEQEQALKDNFLINNSTFLHQVDWSAFLS